MSAFTHTLSREARVAFSLKAQPVWFRVIKWMCLVAGVALFHNRPWFWPTVGGVTVAALLMHLLYRWKTNCWTRAWGGWNDLDAGRD
jgi:hypothetical protein